MNSINLKTLALFVLLILVQVLIFNQMNLFGFINPMIYLLFLILYRFDQNQTLFISRHLELPGPNTQEKLGQPQKIRVRNNHPAALRAMYEGRGNSSLIQTSALRMFKAAFRSQVRVIRVAVELDRALITLTEVDSYLRQAERYPR